MRIDKIYVDSSYDWKKTINGEGIGEISLVHNNFKKIWKERLIVPGLRQLNNRFELLAIRAGLDYALKKRLKNFVIYSDSKVAVGWSKHPKVRWLPREENLAGHIFEARSYPQSIT